MGTTGLGLAINPMHLPFFGVYLHNSTTLEQMGKKTEVT
jgi:hypothetical protein